MNVTNIGFPLSTPALQGGTVDAAAGIGFAGLLGAATGNAEQGVATFGLAGGLPQFGQRPINAQTTTPLMPAATKLDGDAPEPGPQRINAQPSALLMPTTANMPSDKPPVGSQRINAQASILLMPTSTDLPGDKPQVAMSQLLATAAPGAEMPPVAAGGNPLADAVARALANAQGKSDDAAAVPPTTDTIPTAHAEAPTQPKPGLAKPVTAKPGVDVVAAALDESAALPAEALSAMPANAPEAPRPAAPGKGSAKPVRSGGSKEVALESLAASLPVPEAAATAAPVQPIAIPVALPQPVAQAAAPQPAVQPKTNGVAAPRLTKADAGVARDTAPAQAANDKTTDLARAIGAHLQGDAADDAGAKEGGQQSFGQQLAATPTHAAGTMPVPTSHATFAAAAPSAAPAPTEPVINARPGELGRNLGVEIARKVDAGEDTLRVRLNPAELGRVEVTLAFDDKGRVQATMRAESQHTLELLRQDAPDLGRALDQAGIRSDASSFRFESRNGSTTSGGNSQSGFQQQSRGGNQQFRDEPDVQAAAYRPIRGDGQVDLIA